MEDEVSVAFSTADIQAVRSIGQNGLVADIRRIAAIQSNDLAPTNMNGPKPTSSEGSQCCGSSPHSGPWSIPQHFQDADDCIADLADLPIFLGNDCKRPYVANNDAYKPHRCMK